MALSDRLDIPGQDPISVINRGSDGSFQLASGFATTLGPIDLFAVSASLPRGTYGFNCRLLDSVTGEVLAEDLTPFEIQ